MGEFSRGSLQVARYTSFKRDLVRSAIFERDGLGEVLC